MILRGISSIIIIVHTPDVKYEKEKEKKEVTKSKRNFRLDPELS